MSPNGLKAHKLLMRDAVVRGEEGGGRGHLETGPLTPTCVFTNALRSIKI